VGSESSVALRCAAAQAMAPTRSAPRRWAVACEQLLPVAINCRAAVHRREESRLIRNATASLVEAEAVEPRISAMGGLRSAEKRTSGNAFFGESRMLRDESAMDFLTMGTETIETLFSFVLPCGRIHEWNLESAMDVLPCGAEAFMPLALLFSTWMNTASSLLVLFAFSASYGRSFGGERCVRDNVLE